MPVIIRRTPGIDESWKLYTEARPGNLIESHILPPLEFQPQPQPIGAQTIAAAAGGVAGATLGVRGALAVTALTFVAEVAAWMGIVKEKPEEIQSLQLEYLKPFDFSTINPPIADDNLRKSLQKRYDELVAYQLLKMSRGKWNTGYGSNHDKNVLDDEKYFTTSVIGEKLIQIGRYANDPTEYQKQIEHLNAYLDGVSNSEILIKTNNKDDYTYLSMRTLVLDLKLEQIEAKEKEKEKEKLDQLSHFLRVIPKDVTQKINQLKNDLIEVATPFNLKDVQIYVGTISNTSKNKTISTLEKNPLFKDFYDYFLNDRPNDRLKIPHIMPQQLKKLIAARSGLHADKIPDEAANVFAELLDSKKRLLTLNQILSEIISLNNLSGTVGLSLILNETKTVVEKMRSTLLTIQRQEFEFYKALRPVYTASTNKAFKDLYPQMIQLSSRGNEFENIDGALFLLTSLASVKPEEIQADEKKKLEEKIQSIKTSVDQIDNVHSTTTAQHSNPAEELHQSINALNKASEDLFNDWEVVGEQEPGKVKEKPIDESWVKISAASDENPEIKSLKEENEKLREKISEKNQLIVEYNKYDIEQKKILQAERNKFLKYKINFLTCNLLVKNNPAINSVDKKNTIDIDRSIRFINIIDNTYHVLTHMRDYKKLYKKMS